MELQFRQKEETKLRTENRVRTIQKQKTMTKTQLKSKIIIYIDNDKYYVARSAAFALGLTNTRRMMLLDQNRLIELPIDAYNKLKSNSNIEIEYKNVEKEKTLQIYVSEDNYFININAAYSIGYITIEEYNHSDTEYYPITEEMINNLKTSYNIEYLNMELINNESKQR